MEVSVETADPEDEMLTSCLGILLADVVIEALKAQSYRWNVTGMAFNSLHSFFNEIHEDHLEAQSRIAERIKVLGGHVDGKYSHYLGLSKVRECSGEINARMMVENLSNDQRFLSENHLDAARMANRRGDHITRNLLEQRSGVHARFAWMLESHWMQQGV